MNATRTPLALKVCSCSTYQVNIHTRVSEGTRTTVTSHRAGLHWLRGNFFNKVYSPASVSLSRGHYKPCIAIVIRLICLKKNNNKK